MLSGRDALNNAVKRADLAAIRQLLAAGISPNALDADGLPPLAYVLDHYQAYGFSLPGETREMIRLLRVAGGHPAPHAARERVMALASSLVSSAAETADLGTLEQLLG